MLKPIIFDFSDYREYLLAIYCQNKDRHRGFSYRILANKVGFASSATYKLIVEGKRNLSKQSILKIVQGFELDSRESEYFENLVFYNQAENLQEKDHYFKKMTALQRQRPGTPIAPDHMKYFHEWYHSVLRELVCLAPWNGDYHRLATLIQPHLHSSQVKESIEMMLELGFLQFKDNRWIQSEPVIGSRSQHRGHILEDFQKQMLDRAKESYSRDLPTERSGSSTTFGISQNNFHLFVELLREFRLKLTEIARQDPQPERAYQLCINLFPLSDQVESKSNE